MAHIHNEPTAFSEEMLDGFLAAYGRYVQKVPGASGVMRRGGPTPGRVSVVIGGGSGHYPAFCGTVGPGMAHGAVVGDIFTSPSTEQAYRVGLALDGGAGVLFSYGNYAGDVMNFGLAEQRLRAEGIDCRTVLVTDDVASAGLEEKEKRRGVAGDFTVFKMACAAADRGDSLDEVERLAIKANQVTTSFGVAFEGCTLPGQEEPLFTVAPGTMELGLGIHGEPGIKTVPSMSANDLATTLLEPLLAERPEDSSRAALLLNGLGATKYEELFVLFSCLSPLLAEAGIELILPEVGELVTSLDMAGCSLTITWLDDELEELWRAPADSPAFRRDAGTVSLLSVSSQPVSLQPVSSQSVGAGLGDSTTTEPRHAAAGSRSGRQADEAPISEEEAAAAVLARRALEAMLEVIKANETELGRLDAVAGDGDHGLGMVRGMSGAVESARSSNSGPHTLLTDAGLAFADKAGGSSGALWGTFLGGIGSALPAGRAPDASEVAAAMASGAKALQKLGGCKLQDKTMYDALAPFVDDLTQRINQGESLTSAWRAASDLATEKAAATSELLPRLGRARPLAERSLGTPDPGAVSMSLCLEAVATVLEGTPAEGTVQK